MKIARLSLAVVAFLSCGTSVLAQNKQPTVVLNGGNGMGLEITRPVLDMAQGARAVVAVIIHAQAPGEMALEDWKRAQPAEVIPIYVSDVARSRGVLDRATMIWFAGGFTTMLMDAIRETYLPSYIRERWADGVIVGGDSAGGMIFPHAILMTGPADLTSITARRTPTTVGLGLLSHILFDAHFVKRQRINRLLSLVLDHPDKVGVGADEQTAIVIQGDELKVLGASNVIVIDPRNAKVTGLREGQASHGQNLTMHVLTHGMTLDLGSAAPRP